jgi:hypothetical protein
MQFEINFEREEAYECGARLLMALSYVKEAESARNVERFRSLCGRALWGRHIANPDDVSPITAKPLYLFRDRKTIYGDVAHVAKRLGNRLVAGRMAIAFLQHAVLGENYCLPTGIKRLSLNELSEFVLEDAGQADANNVETRIWRTSRPVIHLAAAAVIAASQRSNAAKEVALELFLCNRPHIEQVVRIAVEFEALIASDPKFPVKADQLIRFRLT